MVPPPPPPPPPLPFVFLPLPPSQVAGVSAALQSDLRRGIAADDPVDLDRRRLHFGANVFPQKASKSILVGASVGRRKMPEGQQVHGGGCND